MPVTPYEQRTSDWLKARSGKITASLAAACLCLDPYKGPLSAFREITGQKNRSILNRFMSWGIEHEAPAREEYEVVTGLIAVQCGFWTCEGVEWLGASPDGLVGSDGLVEIKCPQELPAAVPGHHEVQCRVQMAVCGREWVDYFAWTPDGHYLERVHRDRALEESVVRGLLAFKRLYLDQGREPPRRRAAVLTELAQELGEHLLVPPQFRTESEVTL